VNDREANPIGEFLRARRSQLQPSDVGIPPTKRRRVAGLRREEVARLAGVSSEYYLRLEQGRDQHPSDSVLGGIARALLLDEDATTYLFDIARASNHTSRRSRMPETVSSGLRDLMDTWTETPAYVQSRTLEVLASNALARALAPIFTPGVNLARAAFLDPRVKEMWRDWSEMTVATVAGLRATSSSDPDDASFVELVADLSAHSTRFAELWALHEVRPKAAGWSFLIHPVVGELDLRYEKLAAGPPASGQVLVVYYAEPGSPTQRNLERLRSQTFATGGLNESEHE
jgi:transcriptional regulator with XRE-family HTH domain